MKSALISRDTRPFLFKYKRLEQIIQLAKSVHLLGFRATFSGEEGFRRQHSKNAIRLLKDFKEEGLIQTYTRKIEVLSLDACSDIAAGYKVRVEPGYTFKASSIHLTARIKESWFRT
jgi:hypothetical protein